MKQRGLVRSTSIRNTYSAATSKRSHVVTPTETVLVWRHMHPVVEPVPVIPSNVSDVPAVSIPALSPLREISLVGPPASAHLDQPIKAGLIERGWKQSDIDPCLFLKLGMICVVYVDDTIFAANDMTEIDREITSIGISEDGQRHSFMLRDEGKVSAFLGIQIEKINSNEFRMTQCGLIGIILKEMHLEDCNGCDSPATTDPLHADITGDPFSENWRHDSIVGMMYLANNARPDIAYAVHQAARFTHNPRQSHAAGIKRIARYLQQTKIEGMYLCPSDEHQVDCFVDADFAGLFSVEDKQDLISVKSRTGYVIMYGGEPLLWASKMQTQIALSTMKNEYIDLSNLCAI